MTGKATSAKPFRFGRAALGDVEQGLGVRGWLVRCPGAAEARPAQVDLEEEVLPRHVAAARHDVQDLAAGAAPTRPRRGGGVSLSYGTPGMALSDMGCNVDGGEKGGFGSHPATIGAPGGCP